MAIGPVSGSPLPNPNDPRIRLLIQQAELVIEEFLEHLRNGDVPKAALLLGRLRTFFSSPAVMDRFGAYLIFEARNALIYCRCMGMLIGDAATAVISFIEGIEAAPVVVLLVIGLAMYAATSKSHSPVYAETAEERVEKTKALLRKLPDDQHPVSQATRAARKLDRSKLCLCAREKGGHSLSFGIPEGMGYRDDLLAFNTNTVPLPLPGGPGKADGAASRGPSGHGHPSGGHPNPLQLPERGGKPLPLPGKKGPEGPTLPDQHTGACMFPLCRFAEMLTAQA